MRMKNQPKKSKFVAQETREILAANMERLMEREVSGGDKPALLAKRINVSKSTVQRALAGEVGITIDVLTQIAMGLRCSPADLLTPHR